MVDLGGLPAHKVDEGLGHGRRSSNRGVGICWHGVTVNGDTNGGRGAFDVVLERVEAVGGGVANHFDRCLGG